MIATCTTGGITMSVAYLRSILDTAAVGEAGTKIAVEAYQEALRLIGVAGADEGIRESLARHIVRGVNGGERDREAVRDGAINALTGVSAERRWPIFSGVERS
jgi:hypothetical protein